jgi:hypothetical protein
LKGKVGRNKTFSFSSCSELRVLRALRGEKGLFMLFSSSLKTHPDQSFGKRRGSASRTGRHETRKRHFSRTTEQGLV